MYKVVEYTRQNQFVAVIAGMGRNKGKWDSTHSLRTAQHYARILRKENDRFIYKVEGNHG